MHDDSVGPVLPIHTLHGVLYETDASQDLGVALHNLTMASGEAVHSEARGKGGGGGGLPLKPGGQL